MNNNENKENVQENQNNDENVNYKKEKLLKSPKHIIKSSISAVIILIVLLVIINLLRVNNEARVTINTESSLEKIIEISKLSTIEYTYNSIATKYKNDEVKDENVEYYVAYEGVVKAGIDFNEINIDVDYKNKRIIITLPEVEINEISVNMGTLDYIYELS